ncbi:hypothetical protein PFICI_07397 [Pestalotiopsis fici W106-1]|uniref:Uncharacterized protein n=1 Tax=Pestalotiopsis fici (strain W106-1 / CGMCC3.15140) TaxID=1229662 RepID=W3X164_PESFW|nr:uncharacterized protein PFICI_07397 [Pestalotiopsis fici W106-1]ETS79868.1 hypothetical protein PFICI_07397 [Pestalotiopsis fici W106-1]
MQSTRIPFDVPDRWRPVPSLCGIPVDLRLMIYEYAVKLDKAIVPRQVADCSNKFTWGEREQVPVHNHPGNRDYLWESRDNERLAVVSLNLTCKQFYEELRSYPVFYRINRFQFDLQDLVPFLVAVTPERRNAIRHINVTQRSSIGTPRARQITTLYKHAVTVLRNCSSLRDLPAVLEGLDRSMPANIQTTAPRRDDAKFWKQAVDFARLDISGADRSCGFGPVSLSTHTRAAVLQQSRLDRTVDYRLGTLRKYLLPRYDAMGRLLWRVQEITNVRWFLEGPRCEVRWWNTGGHAETTEWEDAHALMTPEGLELFRRFYDDAAARYHNVVWANVGRGTGGPDDIRFTTPMRDLDAELERLRATPMPNEIQAMGDASLFRKRALQSLWRRLQRDYQNTEYMLRAHRNLATEREQMDRENPKKRAAKTTQAEVWPRKRVKHVGSK